MEIAKQGTGVMIGYFLPDSIKESSGSSEPDPHITMGYIGKTDTVSNESLAALKVVLARLATKHHPLSGRLDGIARFAATPSSDNQDVLVRLANIPMLEELRQCIVECADMVGAPVKRNHGYVPHMTLQYVDPNSEHDMKPDPMDVTIDRITLAVNGEHFDYPLTGKTMDAVEKYEEIAPSANQITKRWAVPVTKVDIEKRQVFGWASVAEIDGETVVDSHGDMIDAADLEKAAYSFVLNSRAGGEMHGTKQVGRLIECMMFTKEKQKALGIDLKKVGLWVGFQIDDADTWQKFKDGTYKDFSIGGRAIREDVKT
jgi:2'-5' RNA ligase